MRLILRFRERWVLAAVCSAAFCFSGPAWALPPSLEAQVQQTIGQLKSENAAQEKDACGAFILVEAETVIETETGITNRPYPTEMREAWGCNARPGGEERIAAKFEAAEAQTAGEARKTLVNVIYALQFDREKSAILEGRVTDRDGKGMKGAKVRLVNARNGASFEAAADPSGNYEIQVPSGEYETTASAESCSKTVHKQLCAFGQTSDAASKHAPFRQDFKLDCGELVCEIEGTAQSKVFVQDADATVQGGHTFDIRGQTSLHVDAQTGKITGQGRVLNDSRDDLSVLGTYCDEDGCHEASGLSPSNLDEWSDVTVEGTLQGETAQLTFHYRPESGEATLQGFGDGRLMSESTAAVQGEAYSVQKSIRFAEGQSVSDVQSSQSGGVSYESRVTYTLKKKEDAKPMPAPTAPSTRGPSGSGSEGAGETDSGTPITIPTPGGGNTRIFVPIEDDEEENAGESQEAEEPTEPAEAPDPSQVLSQVMALAGSHAEGDDDGSSAAGDISGLLGDFGN